MRVRRWQLLLLLLLTFCTTVEPSKEDVLAGGTEGTGVKDKALQRKHRELDPRRKLSSSQRRLLASEEEEVDDAEDDEEDGGNSREPDSTRLLAVSKGHEHVDDEEDDDTEDEVVTIHAQRRATPSHAQDFRRSVVAEEEEDEDSDEGGEEEPVNRNGDLDVQEDLRREEDEEEEEEEDELGDDLEAQRNLRIEQVDASAAVRMEKLQRQVADLAGKQRANQSRASRKAGVVSRQSAHYARGNLSAAGHIGESASQSSTRSKPSSAALVRSHHGRDHLTSNNSASDRSSSNSHPAHGHLAEASGSPESAGTKMRTYKLGKVGTVRCDPGDHHSVTRTECLDAARMALPPGAKQESDVLRIGGPSAPPGCSVDESTWSAHFRDPMQDADNMSGSSGFYPVCYHGDVVTWTQVVALSGSGSNLSLDVGEVQFNKLFHECPIVRYKRNGHVHSVYERRTPPSSTFNAYKVFTQNWTQHDNVLNKDFRIYSSLEDAENERDAWQFCVYDFPGVGYPYDCGPSNISEGKWFALPNAQYKAKGLTAGASLEIYTASTGCLFNLKSGQNHSLFDVCTTAMNETVCQQFGSDGCLWDEAERRCTNQTLTGAKHGSYEASHPSGHVHNATEAWIPLHGSSAMQSSTSHDGSANLAVDGKRGAKYQNYDEHSCTHTKHEVDPWWAVDLGADYSITGVEIASRADCCKHRLDPFAVAIDGHVCANASISHLGEIKFVPCSAYGRQVKIELHRPSPASLTLCEVRVKGSLDASQRGDRPKHDHDDATQRARQHRNCSHQITKEACNDASSECEWDHSRHICYFYPLRPPPTQEMCEQQTSQSLCSEMACEWQQNTCIQGNQSTSKADRCMAAATREECEHLTASGNCLYDERHSRCYHHVPMPKIAAKVNISNASSSNATQQVCQQFPDPSSCSEAGCSWNGNSYSCAALRLELAKGATTTLIGATRQKLEKAEKILGTFSSAKNFEVAFDVVPEIQTETDFTSIVRFTNTSHSEGEVGDEMPSFMFWPNSTRLVAVMGMIGDPHANCSTEKELAVHQVARIRGRLSEDAFVIFVDGIEVCRVEGYRHNKYPATPNVAVWASDHFHEAANASIFELTYAPLTMHPPPPPPAVASHPGAHNLQPSPHEDANLQSHVNTSDPAYCITFESEEDCKKVGCAFDMDVKNCIPIPDLSNVTKEQAASSPPTLPGFCLERDIEYTPTMPDACSPTTDAESCQAQCESVGESCFRFVYDPATHWCCIAGPGAEQHVALNKISGPGSCEELNCKWGNWSDWGSCSSTCGIGEQTRSRDIERHAMPGGKDCTGLDAEKTNCSNSKPCPVDCEWSDWNDWADCSSVDACGPGLRSRARSVEIDAGLGGKDCHGRSAQQEPCAVPCGDATCNWGAWSDWSQCTKAAAHGECQKTRHRLLRHQGPHEATGECGESTEEQPCSHCSGGCTWSPWGEWAACDRPCGKAGRIVRKKHQTPGGHQPCRGDDELVERMPCPHQPDCAFCPWSDWGHCSVSCGDGQRARHRSNTSTSLPCDIPAEESKACSVDCVGDHIMRDARGTGTTTDTKSSSYTAKILSTGGFLTYVILTLTMLPSLTF